MQDAPLRRIGRPANDTGAPRQTILWRAVQVAALCSELFGFRLLASGRQILRWRRLLPAEGPTAALAILIGVVATGVGVVLRIVLQLTLGPDVPFVTFFPVLLGAPSGEGCAQD